METINHNYIVDRYLSTADDSFVLKCDTDIRRYLETSENNNSVLVFPPVNNYRRFLIHKVCETVSNDKQNSITTFSIGQNLRRRTVVCQRHQLLIDPKSVALKSSEEAEFSWRYLKRNSVPKYNRRLSCEDTMGVEGNIDYAGARAASNPKATPANRRSIKSNENNPDTTTIPAREFIEHLTHETAKENIHLHQTNGNSIVIEKLTTCGNQSSDEQHLKENSKKIRNRRPDRAVYVPRAKRSLTTPPAATSPPLKTPHTRKSDAVKVQSKSIDLCDDSNSSSCRSADCSSNNPADTSQSTSPEKSSFSLKLPESFENAVIESRIRLDSIEACDPVSQNIYQLDIAAEQEEQLCHTIQKNQKNLNNLSTMSEKQKTHLRSAIPSAEHLTIENAAKINVPADKEDKEEKELRRASQEINRSNRKLIKQTFNSNVLEIEADSDAKRIAEKIVEKDLTKEDEDWDTLFGDNGDCLDAKMLDELTTAVGKVSIEKPKSDYKAYQAKADLLRHEEFPHVLEISNFPTEFRTQDLMMLFSCYKESGFDIKWVDDTHALAVFSSAKIAAEVLAMNHSFVRMKPLAESTLESRTKAKKCSNSLQPYRQRPETCAALARRLVSGALGVRLKTAPEERENERRVLREAKERKLLAAKQREEMWEN